VENHFGYPSLVVRKAYASAAFMRRIAVSSISGGVMALPSRHFTSGFTWDCCAAAETEQTRSKITRMSSSLDTGISSVGKMRNGSALSSKPRLQNPRWVYTHRRVWGKFGEWEVPC
jgi:hypothetical protein